MNPNSTEDNNKIIFYDQNNIYNFFCIIFLFIVIGIGIYQQIFLDWWDDYSLIKISFMILVEILILWALIRGLSKINKKILLVLDKKGIFFPIFGLIDWEDLQKIHIEKVQTGRRCRKVIEFTFIPDSRDSTQTIRVSSLNVSLEEFLIIIRRFFKGPITKKFLFRTYFFKDGEWKRKIY